MSALSCAAPVAPGAPAPAPAAPPPSPPAAGEGECEGATEVGASTCDGVLLPHARSLSRSLTLSSALERPPQKLLLLLPPPPPCLALYSCIMASIISGG